jgi:GTP:adenosylcobinamide-phosphate guanylyltransferase
MLLEEDVPFEQQWGKIMTSTPAQGRTGWSALVLAGNRPKGDALAAHFGVPAKALIDFGGEPMLSHVLKALHATASVQQIMVIAQNTDALADAVEAGGGALLRQSSAGISSSIAELAGTDALPFPILVTTADHPLLEPDLLSAFIADAGDADVAVGMVERAVLFERYPMNKRTWLKFADGYWSGANLFALQSVKCLPALELWSRAEQDRKTAWKLFLHFGPWLAVRALTRTIGLGDAMRQAGKRLGLKARLVPLATPEAAIDVDKPDDHRQALEIWQNRKGLHQP